MKYFANCKNLEELKKEYRRLAFIHHPDRGGDHETMKAINSEYEKAAERLKYAKQGAETESKHEHQTETPAEFIEIIDKLIRMNGVEIEICGSWIWVTGNTYPNREALAEMGFKYSKNKKSWYWFFDCGLKMKRRGKYSMDEIRDKYGSTKVNTRAQELITA